MNKKEFLEELNRHLLVLEDEEQQDILEEYSQHIDMKTESGLSEEEAIRDFGSIKELAAQILEAYHVRAEFSGDLGKGRENTVFKPSFLKEAHCRHKIASFFKKVSAAGKKAAAKCLKIGTAIGARIYQVITWPVRKYRSLRGSETIAALPDTKRERAEKKAEGRRRSAGTLSAAAHSGAFAVKCCFYGILHLFLWGLRWCWNVMMMFLVLCGGLFALGTLFCFGMLLVLLALGYPLIGVTLILLGFVLCGCVFTWFCASLIQKDGRKRSEESDNTLRITEEVQNA